MRKKFEAFRQLVDRTRMQLMVNDQPVKDYPRQPSSKGEKQSVINLAEYHNSRGRDSCRCSAE